MFFFPHCSVLFCFMSHGRPLSQASFHLSISALCAVSSHNKSYFTNVLIDVGQTLFLWRQLQWSDRMTWLITTWSIVCTEQCTEHKCNDMLFLCEISFKLHCLFVEDNFQMPNHIQFIFPYRWIHFYFIFCLSFSFKCAHNPWPNKEKSLTVVYCKRFFLNCILA